MAGVSFILLQALRFDLVSLSYVLAIPLALTPILNSYSAVARIWLPVVKWYLLAVIGLFLFMELATPPFIVEYDIRPNYLFVEYLKYPKEVFSMLLVSYKTALLVAFVVLPTLMWPIYRGMTRQVKHVGRNSP